MATVYRAFDPQLARDVAVKVMHGAFTGRGDIERRFRREAQAVAALKHECIVDVFDFAPGGDGEPAYIVSELVEGPTLRQLLERAGGRIVPEIAVLIAARVAAALGAAHARGIVHRDVKPDNVMIDLGVRKGTGARVLLTDFGIARMTEDDTMTATGSILGSPSYMSPEQAKSGTIVPGERRVLAGRDAVPDGGRPHAVPGQGSAHGDRGADLGRVPAAGAGRRARRARARGGDPALPQAPARRALRRRRRAWRRRCASSRRDVARGRRSATRARRCARSTTTTPRSSGASAARVADAAVERARASVRKGELSRALAQINRALAYAPGHRGAEAVLATISSRRRWAKVAAVVATLCLAGGARRGRARRSDGTRPRPRQRRRARDAPCRPGARRRRAVKPVAAASAAARIAAPSGPPAAREARRAQARRRANATARTRAPPSPPPTPVAAVRRPSPRARRRRLRPSLPPPPGARAARRARAHGRHHAARASGLLLAVARRPAARRCGPSTRASPSGAHEVYCTLPGGARVLAGTYELRAGTHPDLIVLPGADGRPTLGRPQ